MPFMVLDMTIEPYAEVHCATTVRNAAVTYQSQCPRFVAAFLSGWQWRSEDATSGLVR